MLCELIIELSLPGQEFHLEMVFQKWNELIVE